MLEKYHSYWNKWQRGIGKEGCLCGWKGIGSVEMYLLGHVKVSWQTTPGNSVMAVCIVCPYLSTQQSLPQSNSDGRWLQAPAPETHQSCLEFPVSVQKLAKCATVGVAESFILVSSCWLCYRRAARDLRLGCLTSGSTSHSCQRSQRPFKTFVSQFPTCNPWITVLTFLTRYCEAEVLTFAKG